ncbi:hypothetical protein A3J90_03835 [candidate division WOR-1 bacterium RIFOXYC2_FULL_37_10]|uniref:Uncharacterized protein n=1 Tax=candidate division WOR-1 bacterium RIFOXYB2_FULL_37_13 TaxID=1802579 RepID=A0A1F4STD0_UNCSA|nr:MAG: hypothetical protein A2246_02260 [candidate division WOR-1 bacterium RIFOXYA2_FULL_37_7]OGC23714.1 MAG: hypothetical protein A2310_06825 [candidate division WOR-1 bacterium RIFOXYB2_FULL_37_13]OGC36597.1 MAG: hypothetical protein A3J90_03835 [candidate division WOR-1 bacterium RIFOXYC2_FULL_37_10]
MELKEFIKKVLLDINGAVNEASNEAKRKIRIYGATNIRQIEFDIAVSVEESSTKSGNAGVKVVSFAQIGGDMSIENKNSTVSRIKFGVCVDAVTSEESARAKKPSNEDNG